MKLEQQTTFQRLSDNFISLFTLQFINYLVPLFLIPYLVRILGIEGFGLYAFILAIIMYGVKMSDYGFELSATYHVSLHHKNKTKLNEIFSSILTIKVLIALIFMIAITILTFFVDKLLLHQELILSSFGMLFGQILFPLWFFQGIEKMRYIMYLNGLSKIIFLILIFIFIKEESDLVLLVLLNSLTNVFIGIVALYIAITQFNIKLNLQKLEHLIYYLKDGWYIFTSKLAVEFYTNVNIIILGFFAMPLVIGYYAIAVKIIHAIGSLLEPLTRTVYPYLINIYQDSNKNFIKRNQQLGIVIFIIMLPVALLIASFSKEILELIIGQEVATLNIRILEVFSLSLIVYLYGSQFTNMLVTIKKTKILGQILYVVAAINLIFSPILVYNFGVMGMVWLSTSIAFALVFAKGYYLFLQLKSKT